MDSEILPTTDSTLSKRLAIRTRQETDGQGRRSSTENRQSLDPEPPVIPPVQHHSQAPFRKPQSEGLEQTPSQAPRKRRHKKLSRAQSLVQVAIENQREKQVPFWAWSVETGQWGGRVSHTLGALAEDSEPRPISHGPLQPAERPTSLQNWLNESEASPFSVRPPDSVLQSVQAILKQDNAGLAQEHVQARMLAHSGETISPPLRVEAEK